jgi:hypothetical protein
MVRNKETPLGENHWLFMVGSFGDGLLISGLNWILGKPNLEKDDYYGLYIVDRSYFSGNKPIGNTIIFDLK